MQGIASDVDLEVVDESLSATDGDWITIVWDDPVNLMTYVTYVFRTYFGFDEAKAERLMLQVHTNGRAIVSAGGREQQELHVSAMHGYGLLATLERVEG
ncbi:ATP-dependent Clp protease adapter ClpS [Agrococcus versicolor]